MYHKPINSSELKWLEAGINEGIVKTFRTKAEAAKHAKTIGWPAYDVMQIERRFETVWINAVSIGVQQIGFVRFERFNIPTHYEPINGVQTMQVFEVKRQVA